MHKTLTSIQSFSGLNAIQRELAKIGAKISEPSSAPIVATPGAEKVVSQDERKVTPNRTPSVLKKIKFSGPANLPSDKKGAAAPTARKRSFSLPRVQGPRGMNVRFFGGPTPDEDARARWNPKVKRNAEADAHSFGFSSVAAVVREMGPNALSHSQSLPPPASDPHMTEIPPDLDAILTAGHHAHDLNFQLPASQLNPHSSIQPFQQILSE